MSASREQRYRDLIEPLDDRLIATVWRVLRDPNDAEEALQNAMMQIWKKLDRVEAHPNPQALVLKIVANAAYDLLRKRIRDRRRRNGHVQHAIPDCNPRPDARAVQSELSDALREAIATLPRKQAQAAIMRLVQERPHSEIAAALGCSESTARVHVSKARKRLESLLLDYRPGFEKEVLS